MLTSTKKVYWLLLTSARATTSFFPYRPSAYKQESSTEQQVYEHLPAIQPDLHTAHISSTTALEEATYTPKTSFVIPTLSNRRNETEHKMSILILATILWVAFKLGYIIYHSITDDPDRWKF